MLVALAVTSKDRSPVAPDVPTIAESGYPGFDAVGWHGVLAPAKTPPAIVAKLNAEIVQALKDPETKDLLETPGDPGRRQFAEGVRRLHQAGHCDLEGRRGTGKDRGEVTSSSPVRVICRPQGLHYSAGTAAIGMSCCGT